MVVENFVPSLESLSSLGFEERNLGCPGNFARVSRTPGGVQKACAKKVRAHLLFPNEEAKLRKKKEHTHTHLSDDLLRGCDVLGFDCLGERFTKDVLFGALNAL